MTSKTIERIARRKKLKKIRNKSSQNSIFFDLPKGLLVLTLIMISAQVLLSNIIGVKGAELVELEEQKNNLVHKKIILENEISKLSSLSRIESKSREKLTMNPVDKNVYYIEDVSFADAIKQ